MKADHDKKLSIHTANRRLQNHLKIVLKVILDENLVETFVKLIEHNLSIKSYNLSTAGVFLFHHHLS